MRHIEFIHSEHFEKNYYRVPPPAELSHFIDFFWQTKFEKLWSDYPKGFSDAQFPNIGYTYILNLGTPFVMQVNEKKFNMRTDLFLPRYNHIECFHKAGNCLFGIKFRISPVLFTKKIDFSEYQEYIYPLSYLLDASIIAKVKKAQNFEERTRILSAYFIDMIADHRQDSSQVEIVSRIIDKCYRTNDFSVSLEDIAKQNKITLRTLQRYFETCTGISGKKALQVMRIRKALVHLLNDPPGFDPATYGYYDQSHFHKHLSSFVKSKAILAQLLGKAR